MKVILVDDEAPARQRLRALLEKEPDIEIIAECGDGEEALAAIAEHAPDLLFLDIQMPGLNGFDLLRELPAESRPALIFITAFDEHAVRAFEVNALDYLLKPFSRPRLQESLERARAALAQGPSREATVHIEQLLRSIPPASGYTKRLIVKDGIKTSIVPVGDIVCLLAEGNYIEICTTDRRRLLLRETMQNLADRLDPAQFFRASRSAMVHLPHLKEIVSEGKSGHTLRLTNEEKVHLTAPLEQLQKWLA